MPALERICEPPMSGTSYDGKLHELDQTSQPTTPSSGQQRGDATANDRLLLGGMLFARRLESVDPVDHGADKSDIRLIVARWVELRLRHIHQLDHTYSTRQIVMVHLTKRRATLPIAL